MIEVKGVGVVTKSPDTMEINLEILTLNTDYDTMMEQAAAKAETLVNDLSQIGFDKDEIKTINFLVNTKYEPVPEFSGTYKNQFVGYEARHSLRMRFPFDMVLLGEILNVISDSNVNPELSIRFLIEDEQALSQQLLEAAVADAISKAHILANASGVQLGAIQSIEYGRTIIRPYSDTAVAPEVFTKIVRFDFVPEDIELTDTVTIRFAIL